MSGSRLERGAVIVWGGAATVVALAVALVVMLLLPVPSTASARPTAGPASTGLSHADDVLLAAEPMTSTPAPSFTLIDQRGRRITLDRFRGRAVILSFNDDRCTDICTLLAQDVAVADRDLGADRARVAFLSVNANPYHPTVADVRSWSDAHGLADVASWTYATGNPSRLAAVAKAYGETIRLDPRARTVEHATQLVFIDPAGNERLVGLYGTETADTAAFGHALADAAVSLLPAAQRHPVAGASSTAPSHSSGSAGTLPQLGRPDTQVALHHSGRYTVLAFFSSTCTVCAGELPGFEREYRAAANQADYVAVDVADQPAAAQRLVTRTGLTFPVATDPQGTAAARFGVTGLPYTVILDPAGREVTTHPGLLTADQLHYLLQVLPDMG